MGPPIFTDDSVFLRQFIILVNESYQLVLPSIYDPDGDRFNVDVDLGMAVIFSNYSTFKQRSIFMNPSPQHIKAKPYQINIILFDYSNISKKTRYILEVIVKSNTTDID